MAESTAQRLKRELAERNEASAKAAKEASRQREMSHGAKISAELAEKPVSSDAYRAPAAAKAAPAAADKESPAPKRDVRSYIKDRDASLGYADGGKVSCGKSFPKRGK